MTPLMEASRSSQQAIVDELCNRKVQQDTVDIHGNSALHHAVKFGHTEIAALLIESKADLNLCNDFGETPLIRQLES